MNPSFASLSDNDFFFGGGWSVADLVGADEAGVFLATLRLKNGLNVEAALKLFRGIDSRGRCSDTPRYRAVCALFIVL